MNKKMKKVLFTMILGLTMFAAHAQDLTPKAGDYSVGILATPFLNYIGNIFNGSGFNAAPTFNANNPLTLNGKYFTEDNKAFRGTLTLGITHTSAESTNTTDGTKRDITTKNSATFAITAGMEMRRTNKRLVLSYGPQVGIGMFANGAGNVEYTNATDPSQNITISGGNTIAFGIGGFAGVEYFIFHHLSLGAEFNLSLNYFNKSEQTQQTGTTPAIVKDNKMSGFGFGNFAINKVFVDGTAGIPITINFYF